MARSPLFLASTTEAERAMRAGGVRIGLGVVMVAAPGLGRKIFGVPGDQDNGSVRLLARLFGIRQLVLGVWALQVQGKSAEARKLCYQLNAVCDVVDVVALGIAGVTGKGLVQAAVMGSLLGSTETLAWIDLIQQVDADSTEPEGVSLA